MAKNKIDYRNYRWSEMRLPAPEAVKYVASQLFEQWVRNRRSSRIPVDLVPQYLIPPSDDLYQPDIYRKYLFSQRAMELFDMTMYVIADQFLDGKFKMKIEPIDGGTSFDFDVTRSGLFRIKLKSIFYTGTVVYPEKTGQKTGFVVIDKRTLDELVKKIKG